MSSDRLTRFPDIPADLPFLYRSQMLEAIYKFNCTCDLCKATEEEKKESDSRRERIVLIRKLFRDDVAHLSREEIKEFSTELIRLAREEGLDLKLKDYYNELTLAHFKVKDIEAAIGYATAALEEAEKLGENDDEFKRAIRANVEALKDMLRKQGE
jgi:hypothetical protein